MRQFTGVPLFKLSNALYYESSLRLKFKIEKYLSIPRSKCDDHESMGIKHENGMEMQMKMQQKEKLLFKALN